jgi:hypothetical protein
MYVLSQKRYHIKFCSGLPAAEDFDRGDPDVDVDVCINQTADPEPSNVAVDPSSLAPVMIT